MWRRRAKLILIIALLLCITTGCWDALDIEERSIQTFVILDKTDRGYAFYTEYVVVKSSSSSGAVSGQNAYEFNIGEGESLAAAREDLEAKADNPIYLGAVSAVVLTSNMAKHGIEEYMYRLREINDYRKVVHIFITDNAPQEFMILGKGETSVGKMVEDTMQNLVKNNRICNIGHLSDVLEALAGPSRCFMLPNVNIHENDIEITGFSAFSGGVCIGAVPWTQSRGIEFISMKDAEMYYDVPFGQEKATFKLRLKKKKIEPSYQDGKIGFLITETLNAELAYMSEAITFYDQGEAQLKAELEDMIANDILETVRISQKEFRCDYLQFSTYFRIKYPVEYRTIYWEEEFPDAEIGVQVTVDLDTTGKHDFIPQYEF